jgi:hypothetical protein
MLNHGLYTDQSWSVPVTFVDAAGAAVDMSGVQYVAEVFADGVPVFAFRSTGADTDEGTIDLTAAATGVLTFNATEAQHAAVQAGLYRFHLWRDIADDVWTAEGTLLIGEPGARETYLKMDQNRSRTINAAVYLPIVLGGGSSGIDLGNPGGPSGEIFDMGSPS